MLRAEVALVKSMIEEAMVGFKIPKVKAFDDSALKAEILALKDEIKKLKEFKMVNKYK